MIGPVREPTVRMVELTVRGRPHPLSRTGHGQFGGRFLTAPTSRQIGLIVDAWERAGEPRLPDDQPLGLDLRAVFDRPASHSGTGRNAGVLKPSAPVLPIGRPDLDNLIKLVCEALQGNALQDDSRVVRIRAAKIYAITGGARTEIRVFAAETDRWDPAHPEARWPIDAVIARPAPSRDPRRERGRTSTPRLVRLAMSRQMSTTTLRAFHGDPALKASVLAQLRAHREADEIIKGTYWGADGRGCAVGCLTHDRAGGHESYPERWGIPIELAYLEDTIFEGLPHAEALRWPECFMSAIPVGADLSGVADRCAIRRLKRVLELAPRWPEAVRAQVVSAIRQVIAALEAGDERQRQAAELVVRPAAMSARSAAISARSSARSAKSAAISAESAAGSGSELESAPARSAEAAARSAARLVGAADSAAWTAEAEALIEELAAAPHLRDPRKPPNERNPRG